MSTSLSTLSDDLAQQIREGREAAHLTQGELAAAVGCSPRSVQNWEAGISIPRPRHRRALIALFTNQHGNGKAADHSPPSVVDGLTNGG